MLTAFDNLFVYDFSNPFSGLSRQVCGKRNIGSCCFLCKLPGRVQLERRTEKSRGIHLFDKFNLIYYFK